MGIPHRTVPARIDEKAIRVDDPGELVMALARAKATAVVRKLREEASSSSSSSSSRRTTLVIASDQVVVCDGVVREKPADAAQARAFIASYGRSPPSTVGAIVVADVDTGAVFAASDTSTIAFRGPIPEATVGAFHPRPQSFNI
jgi:septum formation protein